MNCSGPAGPEARALAPSGSQAQSRSLAPAAAASKPPARDTRGLQKEMAQGVRCAGSSCEVDRALVDKLRADPMALASSARFVHSIQGGKPNGFKVDALRPGSILARLGLQEADVVKSINGLDVSTPDKALEAYAKLKNAPRLTMHLERRGATVTLAHQIR